MHANYILVAFRCDCRKSWTPQRGVLITTVFEYSVKSKISISKFMQTCYLLQHVNLVIRAQLGRHFWCCCYCLLLMLISFDFRRNCIMLDFRFVSIVYTVYTCVYRLGIPHSRHRCCRRWRRRRQQWLPSHSIRLYMYIYQIYILLDYMCRVFLCMS